MKLLCCKIYNVLRRSVSERVSEESCTCSTTQYATITTVVNTEQLLYQSEGLIQQ